MRPDVELISTGSELLSGRSVNRHAQALGERLRPLGLTLVRDTTIPDDIDVIAGALRDALSRVDIVVLSGGLGPTEDDLTRDAVARELGREVVLDDEALRRLKKRYAERGREVKPASERQAQIVAGAIPLQNPVGMAPGQCLEVDDKLIIVLPGPPREFLAVLEGQVLGRLQARVGKRACPLESVFMTTGLGESDIVTRFEDRGFPPPGVHTAYCAGPARVEVRLSAAEGQEARLRDAADTLRGILGPRIYAEERMGIEEVIGRLLAERGETVAVAESCTGGLLGHHITSISGSSDYFAGGVVAYANEVKVRELGIDPLVLAEHGAVSVEVAEGMAQGVRKRFDTDFGIGITGVAGPTGGTPEKPVGLVFIGVADQDKVRSFRYRFPGSRDLIKEWSCLTALDLLRRWMLGALGDSEA